MHLPTVAALLTHSRLDTIRIYAEPDLGALEPAVAALESRNWPTCACLWWGDQASAMTDFPGTKVRWPVYISLYD